jgi:hypothetical protein
MVETKSLDLFEEPSNQIAGVILSWADADRLPLITFRRMFANALRQVSFIAGRAKHLFHSDSPHFDPERTLSQ